MQYTKALVVLIILSALAHFFLLTPGQPPASGSDNIFADETPIELVPSYGHNQPPGSVQPSGPQQQNGLSYEGDVASQPPSAVQGAMPPAVATGVRDRRPVAPARKKAKKVKKVKKKPRLTPVEGFDVPELEPEEPTDSFLPVAPAAPIKPPAPPKVGPEKTTAPPFVAAPNSAGPKPADPGVKNTRPAVSDTALAGELGDEATPPVATPPVARPQPLDLDGHAAAPSPNLDYEFELDSDGGSAAQSPDLEKELSSGAAGDALPGAAVRGNLQPRLQPSAGGARSVVLLRQRPGNRAPQYDAYSRSKGLQGRGELRYFVTRNGHVEKMQLLKSSGHLELDTLAMDAIKKYKFIPGQAGWTHHPFKFELR